MRVFEFDRINVFENEIYEMFSTVRYRKMYKGSI